MQPPSSSFPLPQRDLVSKCQDSPGNPI
jgi:hypothetical protein